MLATIRDDTWNVLNMRHTTQIRKDGIIQTSLVVALKMIKDPPPMDDGGHQLRNRPPKPNPPTHSWSNQL